MTDAKIETGRKTGRNFSKQIQGLPNRVPFDKLSSN